jgi:hypothetical protein
VPVPSQSVFQKKKFGGGMEFCEVKKSSNARPFGAKMIQLIKTIKESDKEGKYPIPEIIGSGNLLFLVQLQKKQRNLFCITCGVMVASTTSNWEAAGSIIVG